MVSAAHILPPSVRLFWGSCSWGHPTASQKLDSGSRERGPQRQCGRPVLSTFSDNVAAESRHHGQVRTTLESCPLGDYTWLCSGREGRGSPGSEHWFWYSFPQLSEPALLDMAYLTLDVNIFHPGFCLVDFWLTSVAWEQGSYIYLLFPPHGPGHRASPFTSSQDSPSCPQGSLESSSRKHLWLTSTKASYPQGTCSVNWWHRVCIAV